MRNETPELEFQHRGEILWCHIRRRLQQILQFDEEWIIDTPRSETLWSETCRQNGISRGDASSTKTERAAEGPLGFTWWGWLLPQYVDLVDTPADGVWRLRASVPLGPVAPGMDDVALETAHACQSFALGGAFVLGDDRVLRMVFSLALDSSMAEEISQFAAGLLHRQVAYSGYVAGAMANAGILSLSPRHHPSSGLREVPDEFVQNLFEGALRSAPPLLGGERPASPEGMCLTRAFSPEIPALLERSIGWRYRPGLGDPGEAVFSNEPEDDPYTYFSFLPVENATNRPALSGDKYPFKNDPYLRLRMQLAGADTEHYSTWLEALRAANRRLWSTWSDASANVMGCITPVESPAGFYPGQTWVLWPAASLPGPSGVDAWVETIAHLWAHLGDQSKGELAAGDRSGRTSRKSYEEMLSMLQLLRNMDKTAKEFSDLRSALISALDAHDSPVEASRLRAELAKLLW